MRKLFAAAVMGALALGTTAEAQVGVKVGELTCHIGRDVGMILGSRAALECRFAGIGGSVERYDGTITKIGIDVGVTEEGEIVWTVLAPASNVAPGALAGHYYGVSAEVTPGVGVGANVLVGGFDRSLTLQPLSVSGEVGANIAAGLAEMTLEPA